MKQPLSSIEVIPAIGLEMRDIYELKYMGKKELRPSLERWGVKVKASLSIRTTPLKWMAVATRPTKPNDA
jgi:hypothetical protein